ncbi:tetratricopeptide repeat protein [Gracilimonas mengyeensis]|uniref:Uncharacterized protein n=1 Tax=Gracilimonas mengyeensis TaxID=1302730 RepID=A0A521F4K9_9BACT|nr:SEL1-like repeat protein [Gracilimonas mengyeensis]SMO91112.1 hypothetical protein SAMN06265219_11536 [Gracilimonas mengyeensis]
MRNFVILISLAILLTGCGSALKSNWRNFNAYYNTFYNATQSYESGLEKNLNQSRDYNPLQPIRIHQEPVNAGAQEFDKAITKGADILRKYNDTKWVDDALLLIGKSYYYRQEYFSADQKFKELYVTTENPEMKQISVFWQGRVLLEMELYNEGIAFLSEQISLLEEDEDGWNERHKAQVQAVLAQHHVELENWQTAADQLSEALPDLPKKEYKERGYFLLGQIYEQLDDTDAAFAAYDKVSDHYVEYRVQYLALRKTAEVARRLGRLDVAYSIFDNMVRDDKNLEYKAELDFELARTEQDRGNIERSERLYNSVLRNQQNKASAEIRAQAYYGLAEMYRYQYDDFKKAAAYYDSAAQQNVAPERLPEDFKAGELSESFGEYARLRSQVALQDSLLRLGQMSEAEFDSAMAELRKKKIAEIERQRREQRNLQNQIVNTNNRQQRGQNTGSLNNGFLNSDNPSLQQNEKAQFLAIWGDRPLADNWRVASMISNTAGNADENLSEAEGQQQTQDQVRVNIDISNIPFKPAEQDSVRKLIASYQYELGNLFFLSLNMPDSASYYFNEALENPATQNVNMVSLYALSELYAMQENQNQAVRYAQLLVDDYPSSNYARRVSEKYNFERETEEEASGIDTVQVFNLIQQNDTLSTLEKAGRLVQFADSFKTHRLAPLAQFQAIQDYMEAGKQDSLYKSQFTNWVRVNETWEERKRLLAEEKDSARVRLNDTTLTQEQRAPFQAVIDSTLEEPDFAEYFPYKGADWDSARAAIDTFLVHFDTSRLKPRVTVLKQELAKPSDQKETERPREEEVPVVETAPGEYRRCEELDISLAVRGGMEQFLAEVTNTVDAGVNEISYRFRINQRGIVEDYSLLSAQRQDSLIQSDSSAADSMAASSLAVNSDSLNAEWRTAFEETIENNLLFEPVLYRGQAIKAECVVTFPLKDE